MINWYMMGLLGVATTILFVLAYLIITQIFIYKHRFIIYKKTDRGTFVISTKAKEFADSDGTRWFKLLYKKLLAPMPSEDAVNVTKGGKYYLQAYLFDDGQFQYVAVNRDTSKADIISTNQRVLMVKQLRRAESERKHTWVQLLEKFGGLFLLVIGVVMILAVFMIFWADVMAPIKEAGEQVVGLHEQVLENNRISLQITQTLDRLENRVQFVESKTGRAEDVANAPD